MLNNVQLLTLFKVHWILLSCCIHSFIHLFIETISVTYAFIFTGNTASADKKAQTAQMSVNRTTAVSARKNAVANKTAKGIICGNNKHVEQQSCNKYRITNYCLSQCLH